MSLYIGGEPVSHIYVGDKPASAVYAGAVKAWGAPPAPVTFDAAGAGSTSTAWTHNVAGSGLLVAAVTVQTNLGSNQRGAAAFTIGDTAIPQLDVIDFVKSGYQPGYGYITVSLWLFGLDGDDLPRGAQTITPAVSANHGWAANSVSYNNAGGLGAPVDAANAGPGTLTIPVTTEAGQMGVAALAGWRNSTTTTTTTTTTRGSLLTVTTGISTVVVDLIITDAPGPDTEFTAIGQSGSNYTTLGAIALPLLAA